jgi:hypothetical protein
VGRPFRAATWYHRTDTIESDFRSRFLLFRTALVRLPTMASMLECNVGDWQVILELGAEGGSITLCGMETEGGWFFSRNVSDWSPELIGEESIQYKSRVVDSWEAAVALLDQYPWQRLFPLMVHPKFSERIWLAVRDRLEKDQASGRYLDSWRNMCQVGDRLL